MHNSDMEKWISALNTDEIMESETESCECKRYECEVCFPLNESEIDYYLDDSPIDGVEGGDLEQDHDVEADASEDVSELIAQIVYAQDIGMSNSDKYYSEETLMKMSDAAVKRVYLAVVGDLQETSAGGVALGGEYESPEGEHEGIYEEGDTELYRQNGFDSRKDYLDSLADEYGAPIDVVMSLAELLGPNEDFDGLVTALSDYGDVFNESEDYMAERPNSGIKIIPNINDKKADKFLSVLKRAFPEDSFVFDPKAQSITAKGDNVERAYNFVDKIRVAVGEGLEEAKDAHDDSTIDMFPEEDHFDFNVGAEFANAIQNGDLSGLSAVDQEKLDIFLSQLPSGGTWEFNTDAVMYGEEDNITGEFQDIVYPAKYHITEQGVSEPVSDPQADLNRIKNLAGL